MEFDIPEQEKVLCDHCARNLVMVLMTMCAQVMWCVRHREFDNIDGVFLGEFIPEGDLVQMTMLVQKIAWDKTREIFENGGLK